VSINVQNAVSHAREAAQRGAFDAMIDIGPRHAAGAIDPYEFSAWTLISASTQLQGCGRNGCSVSWMKANTLTLNSTHISPTARVLAEKLWQSYGAQIERDFRCSP
jgi:hypothetical protein